MKGNITNDIGTVLKIFEKLDRYNIIKSKNCKITILENADSSYGMMTLYC